MKFNNDNKEGSAHHLLERFFASDIWQQISTQASLGDDDSLDLMNQISDQLASLTWHIQNDPDSNRVQYELKYFKELCEDFDINE